MRSSKYLITRRNKRTEQPLFTSFLLPFLPSPSLALTCEKALINSPDL